MAKPRLGETLTTFPFYERAIRSDPQLAGLPDYCDLLSFNFVKQGSYAQGLEFAEKGYQLAVAAGRGKQAQALQQRAEFCRGRQ
jgi:hypothetical protein